MLTYNPSQTVPQIQVDVVRLNDTRFTTLLSECRGDEGYQLGAFMEQYDFETVIFLHRGDVVQHNAFMNRLQAMM